jgi:hypothetical protein
MGGVLTLAFALPGRSPRAAAEPGLPEVTPQTDASVTVRQMTLIGATPQEAGAPGANEAWGVGEESGRVTLVRYTSEGGWSLGPGLQNASGQPLSGFRLDQPGTLAASPLTGQMTPNGSGALVGTVPAGTAPGEPGTPRQVVLIRNPGGPFAETPLPEEGEAALQPGESLFGAARAPLLAPLEESPARAGLLLVPVVGSGVEQSVLHWDGNAWSREPIEVPAASKTDFRVLGIGASSESNAWLLAQLSSEAYPPGSVALFRRNPGGEGKAASWHPVSLVAGAGDGEAHPLVLDGQPFTVPGTGEPPTVQTQVLTVTSQGVWVDGRRSDVQASATLFFKPEGEGGGQVLAGWCRIPASAPAGTKCDYELPEALATRSSRSMAWAGGSSPFGERVITGFIDGVSLRLAGTEFTRVRALGGSEPPHDVGGTYGAAFASAREGWLGEQLLPVHLTLHPAPNRLGTWPVPFSHALLAIAPQPGVPVGSLSSQVLAVGDLGEVARYVPGTGWLPESLLSSGGRRQTPRLRAVAWPTPTRAYAVGDLGQMWLWRGETGLWEPDPATPVNFRGNLMGVAFDPNNSSRGYAVGESGVLLSYGKSWTQTESLPPAAAGADFTSINFAGSEAIVTYRRLRNPGQVSSYVGGLLINDGSGWRVDGGAAEVLGSGVPGVVAGLSDGGAAFTSESFSGGPTRIIERESSSSPWQVTPTPFPSGGRPGSLALFRESGALRAIASGGLGGVEPVEPSPPGFPPPLVEPYGLGANGERSVIRQTSRGWSDEEHELNDVRETPGHYSFYDVVYQPDPISAVLIDPSGTQGWAVGGNVEPGKRKVVEAGGGGVGTLDTADVARYPADGVSPPGVGGSTVPLEAQNATFAIGGGAPCAAPCADRANARIGPRVWLSSALARAQQIGVRAFLYTGAGITNGETAGPSTVALPYREELFSYAATLGSSLAAFSAIAPAELNSRPYFTGAESTFNEAFSTFFSALSGGSPAGVSEPVRPSQECSSSSPGCQTDYYAFTSSGTGGAVRVIVLDTTAAVGSSQLSWLAEELTGAAAKGDPAIVVGNVDLNAQIAAGDGAASAVSRALIAGNASAYFYDSPERNIALPLNGSSIPTFGSGTLGYVSRNAQSSGEFLGASGFLLAQIGTLNPATKRAPVSVRLIPDIGELAMEAKDGTLLRRSQPALFSALARRPRAGNRAQNKTTEVESGPYIPIPLNCIGSRCATGVFPEYSFSSSRPDIGDFVKPNLASADPRAVELGPEGKPIPDPQSGLFCAYNAGTTIVTISAGGLSSSLPVTVQAGSVRRPCGTTLLKELPAIQQPVAAPPPAAPTATPTSATPASNPPTLLPVPAPPVPTPVQPAAAPAPAPPPFLVPAPLPVALLAVVPPPVPTPARPTPPSGTSAVTSPVEAPEREEEEEEAPESVSNKAVAYHTDEHNPAPAYILGIVVLAAFAGASARRRPRRGRRELRVARATITSTGVQRGASDRRR